MSVGGESAADVAGPINGWVRRLVDRLGEPLIKIGLAAAVIAIGLFALSPVLIAIVTSFRVSLPGEPAEWSVSGWRDAFASAAMWKVIGNTFLLALMRVPFSVIFGAIMAWLLIRTNVIGRKTIEFMFWIAFFLPTLPMAMAWVLLFEPGGGWVNLFLVRTFGLDQAPFKIYSYFGITWVHITASTVPVMIILLGPAFRGLNPSLEESARMSGASNAICFRRIVLPLVAPAVITAAIASMIRSLEAFEIELYLGVPAGIRVYSTKIHEYAIYDPPRYAPSMALSVPFVALLFLLALLYQRYLKKRQGSFATVTGKSSHVEPIELGRWRLPTSIFCMLCAGIVVVVPTVVLLLGSFMDLFGVTYPGGGFGLTFEHWEAVFEDNLFLDSVIHTVELGLGAAAIGVLVFSMIAYLIIRSNAAGRDILDIVVWLPWAIPGILLSLALLWMYLGTPVLVGLYGTIMGLILAMVFKEMPIGINLMKAGILQIGPELEEAARMAGANWWQIYWRLYFPLLAPTGMAVAMLVFISSVKDISTMVLLSTPETRPLSILLLDYMTNGLIESGAVVGVISTVLTVGVAFVGRAIGLGMK
jgi:iron(III) transport system permease protein